MALCDQFRQINWFQIPPERTLHSGSLHRRHTALGIGEYDILRHKVYCRWRIYPLHNQVASRNKKRFPLERTPSKGPGLENNNLTSCASLSLCSVFKVLRPPSQAKQKLSVAAPARGNFKKIPEQTEVKSIPNNKIYRSTGRFSNLFTRFAPAPPPIWSLAGHQALVPRVCQWCVNVVRQAFLV